MSESGARTLLTVLGVIALIGYIVAIVLAVQGLQFLAVVLLVVSLVDTAGSYVMFRIYTGLRKNRWQNEIKATEDKMAQLLAEESKKPKT